MPFQKGVSGNPAGRPKHVKLFRNAIDAALRSARADEKNKKKSISLEDVAKALIAKAMSGDVPAIKELADRLDGKPATVIENGEDGPLQILVRKFVEEGNE